MSKDKLAPFEVLLVEDNDEDADSTIKTLTEKTDGCRVTRAENGQDALDMLCKKGKFANTPSPSLLLLDLTLPGGIGGLDVLAEIRKSNTAELKNLPVLIMTVSTSFQHYKTAHNLRVADYMPKPVAQKDLVAAVKRLLPDPDLSENQRIDLAAWVSDYRDA